MADWIGSKRIPVGGKNAPTKGFAIEAEVKHFGVVLCSS